MEEIKLDEWIKKFHEFHGPFILGDWGASCWGKTFKLNIKLAARDDEGLEKIIFDTDKKTVSVIVKNPTLSLHVPRIVDLSNDKEFFEALQKN